MLSYIKAVDYSLTGQSFGLYLFVCDTATGKVDNVVPFEGVGVGHTKRQIAAIATGRGLEASSAWRGLERSYVVSGLSISKNAYDAARKNHGFDMATVNPYLATSINGDAWEMGKHMSVTGMSRPRSYKRNRGNKVTVNDIQFYIEYLRGVASILRA